MERTGLRNLTPNFLQGTGKFSNDLDLLSELI